MTIQLASEENVHNWVNYCALIVHIENSLPLVTFINKFSEVFSKFKNNVDIVFFINEFFFLLSFLRPSSSLLAFLSILKNFCISPNMYIPKSYFIKKIFFWSRKCALATWAGKKQHTQPVFTCRKLAIGTLEQATYVYDETKFYMQRNKDNLA